MPGPAFPSTIPTLSGDVLTINRLLQSPTLVQRRLRDLADRKFIADQLLTGSVEATGGAVAYEVSESIETDRDPSAVAPGAEYERALATVSAAQVAAVTKYGQDVPITDESIGRYKMNYVERSMRKSVNRTVRYVDTVALAAVASAVTQTQAAAFAWNLSTADPFLDIMLADATVDDLGEGYETNAVFLTATLYARLVANQKVIAGLRRESSNTVTETGEVLSIAGKKLVSVPSARMPSGVSVLLADTNSLGAIAYETIPSPEYQGAASGIQSWIRRDPTANDSWLLRTRRSFVPIVQEPASSVKITGA